MSVLLTKLSIYMALVIGAPNQPVATPEEIAAYLETTPAHECQSSEECEQQFGYDEVML